MNLITARYKPIAEKLATPKPTTHAKLAAWRTGGVMESNFRQIESQNAIGNMMASEPIMMPRLALRGS